jgi:hypothetical protein
MSAPVASGWSGRRVGFAPTGEAPPCHGAPRKQSFMTHELMQNDLLRYLDALMVSREQRLAFVTASIPRVLWYVVFTGAFLMIAFLRMLYMELVSQIILGGITAFFLGNMIFLIYEMDRPLKGAVSVRPDSFQSVYDLVMRWDEPA